MTKELIIHLVKFDNDGNALDAVNNATLLDIARTFGGFTATEGRGAWFDTDSGRLFDEPVIRVTIASNLGLSGIALLSRIANQYKAAAKQLAVYVRDENFNVTFV